MSEENMGVGVVTPGPRSFFERYFWFIVVSIVLVAGSGILYVQRQNSAVTWQGSCEAVGHRYGSSLFLNCAGKEIEINDNGVAFSYALNPGPLNCKIYSMGGATCSQRPFKK